MTTGFFNRPTQAVINALSAGKQHITEAEVIALTGIKPRLVETTLAEAMELSALIRRRIGTDLVYMLPSKPEAPTSTTISRAATATPLDTRTVAEHTKATSQPKPAHKPRGGRMQQLPPIDVASLQVTYRPPFDSRQSAARKWDPLFDALASHDIKAGIDGPELPTFEAGREYHGALQQAARDWMQRRKNAAAFKAAVCDEKTVVQRVS